MRSPIIFIPRISVGPWGGGSLSDPEAVYNEVVGTSIALEWLGLFLEVCVGRVKGCGR
ncbi:hypothetical protein [Sphingobium yanoikuyae]|uniref:hypothetical protein n=1 Tax=Sphingobium yanoikuyae TaxID=13690 RepID=UPI002FDD176A